MLKIQYNNVGNLTAIILFVIMLTMVCCAYNAPKQQKFVMKGGVVHEVVCRGKLCKLVPRPDLKEIPK